MYASIASIALLLATSVWSFPYSRHAARGLNETALKNALEKGKGILGTYADCSITSKTCEWMASVDDETKLVHMSLPGTHDAATWNYTQERQNELKRYTGDDIRAAKYYRCQNHSMFDMLNGGIRVFDWRVAYNPGNVEIGFYHGAAVLDPIATLQDVLYGFYYWLDQHPSEAILISLNHEGGTGTPDDAAFYQQLYETLNSSPATEYWSRTNGTLGTLGAARGKLTLLQRFNWDALPSPPATDIGIFLSPSQWTDNSPDFEIIYNEEQQQKAFVEDFYQIFTGKGSIEEAVSGKLNATLSHLERALNEEEDQLWISFSSGFAGYDVDAPVTPDIMALGQGAVAGVNQQLHSWLDANKGGRFGVIMLDFYDSVTGVVEAIIGV